MTHDPGLTTGDLNADRDIHIVQYIINGQAYFGPQQAPEAAAPTSVFLSYARADDDPDYDDPARSFMRRLYTHLTAAGFSVWWDRVSLPARGLSFTAEIEAAVRACDRFLLVCGPGALKSDYVRAEWAFAATLCKPIMPVLRAGDYDMVPDAVAIREVNAIDVRPSRDEAAALADVVARLRQPAPLGQPLNVPPLKPTFVLREAIFSAARDALCADAIQPGAAQGTASAVAIYGLGGLGKSTLAVALAHDCQVRRNYPDGVLWVEARPGASVPGTQRAVGVMLGDDPANYDDETLAGLSLSRTLSRKSALIVLDDVWERVLVQGMPVGGTACRLLITTRDARLAADVQGADLRLASLTDDEGAALIARHTSRTDDAAGRQISRALGGHTLAIELAARQIDQGVADDAADMLRLILKRRDGPQPFADLVLDEGDKNTDLALSLALSYDALGGQNADRKADLQRRFRLTGAFALESTFDRAALAALWGDDDPDEARRPLADLVAAGLLDRDGDDDGKRYSQHGLLRAYARGLLRQAGTLDDAAARHHAFYLGRYGGRESLDLGNDRERVAQDAANIDVAIAHGLAVDALVPDTVSLLISYDGGYLQFAAATKERLRRIEAGHAAALRAGHEVAQANTLKGLGDLLVLENAYGEARERYEAALALYEAVDARLGQANTLKGLGDLLVRQNAYGEARERYEAALALFEAVADRLGQANTLEGLGDLLRVQEDYRGAREMYDLAAAIYDAIGSTPGRLNVLIGSARLARAQGDIDGARAYFARLFEMTDAHPAFRDHPMTQQLRQEAAALDA